MLIGRQGVKGGETRVFDANGPHGVRFLMQQPLTALLLDDARVIHETTPILPADDLHQNGFASLGARIDCNWGEGFADNWQIADRFSAGLLPPAVVKPEAAVRIFAARTVRWRGIFAAPDHHIDGGAGIRH